MVTTLVIIVGIIWMLSAEVTKANKKTVHSRGRHV